MTATLSARPRITSADAWTGAGIQDDPSWTYRLNDAEIAEIDAALLHAKRSGASTSRKAS